MDPHSCQHCKRLVIELRTEGTYYKRIAFPFTREDIRAALSDGCLLLRAIMDGAKGNPGTDPYQCLQPSRAVRYRCSHELAVLEFGIPVCWSLRLYKRIPSDAPEALRTTPINPSPNTAETYNLARSWLCNCIESHNEQKATSPFIPSRLVRISKPNGIYELSVVASEEYQPYVALSYCWGGDQEYKSTLDNILGAARNYTDLPRTIQDAIKVTWELGYRHLWVDSLCILQDSDEDKAREISLMPLIYGRAICTILASTATQASQGFLHPRHKHQAFELQLQVGDQSSKIYGINLDNFGHVLPLDARGWALQERLLSNHVLEFNRRQLRFRCAYRRAGHGLVDGWTSVGERTALLQMNEISTIVSKEQLAPMWRRIVTEYAGRMFTIASDRPLAISGIADRIGKQVDDTYIAGHWLSMLPVHLLWRVEFDHLPDGAWKSPRRSDLRAPSWSWTSISHAIAMAERLSDKLIKERQLQVCAIDTELQHPKAPYGAVKRAVLTVKGRMMQASCEDAPWIDHPSRPWEIKALRDPSTGHIWDVYLHLDYPVHDFGPRDGVSLLEVFKGEYRKYGGQRLYIEGLVLREVEPSANRVRRFKRLGILNLHEVIPENEEEKRQYIRKLDPFSDCPEEIIELA